MIAMARAGEPPGRNPPPAACQAPSSSPFKALAGLGRDTTLDGIAGADVIESRPAQL
jgi:hypothetical protein